MSRRSPIVPRALAMLTLVLAATLSACGEDPVSTALPPEARIDTTTFAPSLGINLADFTVTESGLYWKDLLVGTGDQAAAAGDTVTVHYIGWLPNGTVFDQSSPDAPPFGTPPSALLIIGAGSVIAGWDEGLVGMKVGGHRMLIVPPSLGYGYAPNGRIPANSVLVFRIDLVTLKKRTTTP